MVMRVRHWDKRTSHSNGRDGSCGRRLRNKITESAARECMRVKFWGVRGSTPTPQAENLRYGGNTSCVEVRVGDRIYIFDCGTGLRMAGEQLIREFAQRPILA